MPGAAWESDTIATSPPLSRRCSGSPEPPSVPRTSSMSTRPRIFPGKSPGETAKPLGNPGEQQQQRIPTSNSSNLGSGAFPPPGILGKSEVALPEGLGTPSVSPGIVPSPSGTRFPGVWQFPHPESPRDPPARGCLFEENDESVLKQPEPVFTRVFSARTNRKICRQRLLSSSHMSAAASPGESAASPPRGLSG